jgi:hypothetical protein
MIWCRMGECGVNGRRGFEEAQPAYNDRELTVVLYTRLMCGLTLRNMT